MILSEYNPKWPVAFQALKSAYATSLSNLYVTIEHVGSTAIPGIMAKPIIDIDIVIKNYQVFPQVVEALAGLGYRHNGDQGIKHREAFKRADDFTPQFGPQKRWINHHLYVCPSFSVELGRQIAFRDYLRAHVDARSEYEEIKVSIAGKSGGDRKRYAAIKETECRDFVERILAKADLHSFDEPGQGL